MGEGVCGHALCVEHSFQMYISGMKFECSIHAAILDIIVAERYSCQREGIVAVNDDNFIDVAF